MRTADPTWRVYERCVSAFCMENFTSLDATVIPNASLVGGINSRKRQIDVLVDRRWYGNSTKRILVDAKMRRRAVDVKQVEAFEGMMKDCGADHGIIVCTNGYTAGARRRAQDLITIMLLNFDDAVDEFGWQFDACLACGDRGDDVPGAVLWDYLVTGSGNAWVMLEVGKCDKCRTFNVCCQDCGTRFYVPDRQVVSCYCEGRQWGSIQEGPETGWEGEPESIWLMMREYNDQPVAIDRKPIR